MEEAYLEDLNLLYNTTRGFNLPAQQHEKLRAAAERVAAILTQTHAAEADNKSKVT